MSDTQKHTKPNVPNLRFPGFEGEWEHFALGQLCEEFQSGKGITSEQIKEIASYPVYGGNGLRGYADSYNHEGVYTLIGRQGAKCGNVRLVSGKTYITEHAIAVKANRDNVTEFLNWLFIKMNLGQYSDQSAQPGLAVNKLVRLTAFVPKKAEQKKIAELLALIDARITLQSKVIEDYKILKSTIRARIAKEISNNWISLSELIENGSISLKRGQVIPKKEQSSINIYPVYSSSIVDDGLMGYNDTYMFDDELVSWSIDGGGNFFYRPPHKFNITNVSGVVLADKTKWDYRFISEILIFQHSRLSFDYQTKAHPSVIQSLYSLPEVSIENQKQIARIFELLDCQMRAHNKLLSLSISLRQYLLQKLFI